MSTNNWICLTIMAFTLLLVVAMLRHRKFVEIRCVIFRITVRDDAPETQGSKKRNSAPRRRVRDATQQVPDADKTAPFSDDARKKPSPISAASQPEVVNTSRSGKKSS